ncbi:rhamnogalacturonan lyase [Pelagicoccus sp. SDUM812003]|uniref:rhamnogalacturonan lyase n=1 Tax=Pelagicoccus sp. SDUM812003 TaxID=3041267 RepID=UPI00280D2191|nr:rhamnogalacturonan lyase [Pelagicoccus sp. SDUM812003]MDQ8202604.1 rhamnogalacturonan lyase [Pelagicoccus sp. SDUM812003]
MPSLRPRPLASTLALICCTHLPTASQAAAHQMEALDRGLIAVKTAEDRSFLSWRLLATDEEDTQFHVYRAVDGGLPTRISEHPLQNATCFIDNDYDGQKDTRYFVRPISQATLQPPSEAYSLPKDAPTQQYLEIPLSRPAGGVTPDNQNYSYSPNDCSAADLDNDGQYEIIVKWDPSNAQDNSRDGYTGNVYLDAYEMDGTQLWRIDLGRNIRAGAHYTQFIAYDFDGDGFAEIACKTADATVSGTGEVIGDAEADYRNGSGRILEGPEFLTLFNGQDGSILKSVDYVPQRGRVTDWGDGYGNRVDRFLAGVAYLDGERPSLIMCRGYYTRTVVAAWDWSDGELVNRWTFDTDEAFSDYASQGAHSLTIGDLDGDQFDEIVYGACSIDHDGTGLYNTTLGHGDALHLSDMDPTRDGLEIWMVHESPSQYNGHGSELHDAATGEIIYSIDAGGDDVGRGMASDIDPNHLGYETWSTRSGLYNASGTFISERRPSAVNFACYWDGDLLREMLDRNVISKWNWETESLDALLVAQGATSNNGTKATPALSADLFGDWREEVVWRTEDNAKLRIYTTTEPTEHRFVTLMHDRQYRVAIAWQNSGYNQPPHPSFYLGEGMQPPAWPDIYPAGDRAYPIANAEERFQAWLGSIRLPLDSPPDLDHDSDGYTLREEYAYDLKADEPHFPVTLLRTANQSPTITVSTPRSEYDYRIEHSYDLQTWQSSGAFFPAEPHTTITFEEEVFPIFFRTTFSAADEN